jgi:NADH-quinone oxidoreductase subunit C
VYFPGFFLAVNFSTAKTVILTVRNTHLLSLVSFLKNSMFFNLLALTDLWATDFPARRNRFELTYSLLSNKKNMRVYIKTFVNEWEVVPSVTQLFESAAWLEREVWDMFGVAFSGHTDLRRILTDYGFFGFPLRKDFPLTGFSELRYDDTTRRVASEHLNLIQELRLFFFGTPWKNK